LIQLEKQEQYNQVIKRLVDAEVYFETMYVNDSQEGKAWAIDAYRNLLIQHDDLYSELRLLHSSNELENGFSRDRKTFEFDCDNEIEFIHRFIQVICSEGWKVESIDCLFKSKKILIGMVRSYVEDSCTRCGK